MVDLFHKKQQQCKKRPFPFLNLTSTTAAATTNDIKLQSLGSGITSPTITDSIKKNNDPYMPHITPPRTSSFSLPQQKQHPARRSTNHSAPTLVVTHHNRQPVTPTNNEHHHHHHYYFTQSPPTSPRTNKEIKEPKPFYSLDQHTATLLPPLSPPPLSPPPLSPTHVSFAATATRPSWRDIKRPPTWQPASSISSSSEQDDDDDDGDDDEPLFHLMTPTSISKPFSLLSDATEDGDDELVPIARLTITSYPTGTGKIMSAAEKYKAKVKAQLQMNDAISPPTAGII